MKTNLLLAAAVALISLLAISASAQKSGYIGYRHKGVIYGETLPNGVKDLGGGLLSDQDYGVSRFMKGEKFMLWLEKVTSRDNKGVPHWEVKDVLSFGSLKKHQEFLFSYSSACTQNDKDNLDLIVKAEFSPKKKKYKILEAWKADIKKEKFEKISTKGIECEYVEP